MTSDPSQNNVLVVKIGPRTDNNGTEMGRPIPNGGLTQAEV